MTNAKGKSASLVIGLTLLALLLLAIGGREAQAGNYQCGSGECWMAVFSGQCFRCLINPAPAHCSCSVQSTCPQAATECGNCDLAGQGSVVACTDKCSGCTHPLICPPAKGNAVAASAADKTIVPIKPRFAEWINSQSLLSGVSDVSPLMKEMILHMRNTKEQWGCSYITGLVMNLKDRKHVQSKVTIHTNEDGVTTFTIFNRSTGQDETLIVQAADNTWQLRTEPSYAPATPEPTKIIAQGVLDLNPQTTAVVTEKPTPIQPTYSQWINSDSLFQGVSAISALMKQLVLHMREAKEEWSNPYSTGFIVDPNDPEHIQSKVIVNSNQFGITTFTIINRTTNLDETLIVHASKNMWQLRAEPSFASAKGRPVVVMARGTLDGR